MSRRRSEVCEEFPELEPLTKEELAAFVDAACARVGLGSSTVRVTVGLIALGLIGFGLLATSWIWGWALLWLYNLGGTGAVVVVVCIVVVAVSSLFNALFVTDKIELFRRSGLLPEVLRSGRCAGCEYSLDGLEKNAVRAGAVRCPECGLVNPRSAHSGDRATV